MADAESLWLTAQSTQSGCAAFSHNNDFYAVLQIYIYLCVCVCTKFRLRLMQTIVCVCECRLHGRQLFSCKFLLKRNAAWMAMGCAAMYWPFRMWTVCVMCECVCSSSYLHLRRQHIKCTRAYSFICIFAICRKLYCEWRLISCSSRAMCEIVKSATMLIGNPYLVLYEIFECALPVRYNPSVRPAIVYFLRSTVCVCVCIYIL